MWEAVMGKQLELVLIEMGFVLQDIGGQLTILYMLHLRWALHLLLTRSVWRLMAFAWKKMFYDSLLLGLLSALFNTGFYFVWEYFILIPNWFTVDGVIYIFVVLIYLVFPSQDGAYNSFKELLGITFSLLIRVFFFPHLLLAVILDALYIFLLTYSRD